MDSPVAMHHGENSSHDLPRNGRTRRNNSFQGRYVDIMKAPKAAKGIQKSWRSNMLVTENFSMASMSRLGFALAGFEGLSVG